MSENEILKERLCTVREVAEAAQQTPVTIYRHIDKGALPARKVGGNVRIALSDAREYLGEKAANLPE